MSLMSQMFDPILFEVIRHELMSLAEEMNLTMKHTTRCGSSILNPREFVGGFDELAIACLYGDAGKRILPGGPKRRTPNPHRAAVGSDRPAPSNRCAEARRNSSPVLSPLGSAVLNLVLALVAPMARQLD